MSTCRIVIPHLSLCAGSHVKKGSPVMVTSTHGISRCSAATIAFLMHHFKYSLEVSGRLLLCYEDLSSSTVTF